MSAKELKKWQAAQAAQKNIEWFKAYNAGYKQGMGEGAEMACELWVAIMTRTKGIGPALRERLLQSAREAIQERETAAQGPQNGN
jgi:hypothetical protein